MGGVVAGGATLYVPKELPSQDREVLGWAAFGNKGCRSEIDWGRWSVCWAKGQRL